MEENLVQRMGKELQTKIKKRWTALCLAVVTAVSLIGCGGPAGGRETTENGTHSGSMEDGNEAVALGRYVEAVTEVDAGPIMDLRELADGRLVPLQDGAVDIWKALAGCCRKKDGHREKPLEGMDCQRRLWRRYRRERRFI